MTPEQLAEIRARLAALGEPWELGTYGDTIYGGPNGAHWLADWAGDLAEAVITMRADLAALLDQFASAQEAARRYLERTVDDDPIRLSDDLEEAVLLSDGHGALMRAPAGDSAASG